MNRPPRTETTFPDEPTQRAWEEMRAEALHEIQDGGEVPDVLLDAIGEMLTQFPYRVVEKILPTPRPVAV